MSSAFNWFLIWLYIGGAFPGKFAENDHSRLGESFRYQTNTRPNIVLIVADDHGREALGCYGDLNPTGTLPAKPTIRTPHIDQLAADGVRFSNAFCTTASCSPSRSVLLTGLHNHANGMYGLEHQEHHFSSFDTVRSLPVLLEKAGYRTARIGKLHVAPEKVYHFQQVLKAGGVNDPASIGRSPVEMARLCYSFLDDKLGSRRRSPIFSLFRHR